MDRNKISCHPVFFYWMILYLLVNHLHSPRKMGVSLRVPIQLTEWWCSGRISGPHTTCNSKYFGAPIVFDIPTQALSDRIPYGVVGIVTAHAADVYFAIPDWNDNS